MRYAVAIFYALELALAAVGALDAGPRSVPLAVDLGDAVAAVVHRGPRPVLDRSADAHPLMGVVVLLAAQGVLVLASRNRDAKPMATAT